MELRPLFCAVALLASGGLLASVTEEETFSFELNDGGRFSVSNVNGSIAVTGGPGNNVEIVALKKADNQDDLDEIEISISRTDDEIIVETDLSESDSWFSHDSGSGSVRYEIIVPAATRLKSVETVNGDVEISGITGEVDAETVNGELDLSGLSGDVSVSTVNGGISAAFSKLEGQQRVRAETVNGRVTVTLPANADVSVSADSLNGSINGRDFGLETDKGFVGSDLNGKIGSGSASLKIDTVNGSIKIRKD